MALVKKPPSPTHQLAYDELKAAIMSGAFAPGESFSINRLSVEYGFGFTPMREALKRLGADGAIEIEPKKAMRIPILSRQAAKDVCDMRLLIEGEAAANAARNAKPSVIRKLKTLINVMERRLTLDSPSKYLEANRDFHFTIYNAADMHFVVPIIEMLWLQIGPLQTYYTPESKRFGHELHYEIVSAIEAQDAKKAKSAMRKDIKSGVDILLPFVPD